MALIWRKMTLTSFRGGGGVVAIQEARSLKWVSPKSPILSLTRAWDVFSFADVHWEAIVRVRELSWKSEANVKRGEIDSIPPPKNARDRVSVLGETRSISHPPASLEHSQKFSNLPSLPIPLPFLLPSVKCLQYPGVIRLMGVT